MWHSLVHAVAATRRRALVTVCAAVLLAIVVPQLAPKLSAVQDDREANDPPAAAESVHARDLLRRAFPDERGTPAVIVVRDAHGLTAADMAEVGRIGTALSGPNRPAEVAGAVSAVTDPAQRTALTSADGTTTMIMVAMKAARGDEAFQQGIDQVRDLTGGRRGDLRIKVTGPAAIARDTNKVFASANVVLFLATLALVLVLLLVIYRSPLLAAVSLVAVGVALQLTQAIGAALVKAGLFQVTSETPSIMTVVLFGIGTDYCLFVISRYREELAADPDRQAAMGRAMAGVGEAIASSATTIVLALLALLLATLPALRGFGPLLALSVALMFAVTVLLVPALLILLGGAAFWPGKPPAGHGFTGGFGLGHALFDRIAALVIRRPAGAALIVLALVGTLSAGLAGYKESYNWIAGFRVGTDSQQGQRMLQEAFPAGRLAPTTVLVRAEGGRVDAQARAIDAVASAVAGVPGVREVSGPTRPGGSPSGPEITPAGRPFVSPSGQVARLTVVYADDPYGAAALDRTDRVRDTARAAARGAPVQVLVGGETAITHDIRAASNRDLLLIAPVTLLLILLVLGLLFRSLLAPLYLVATIVATVFAALGLTSIVMLTLGHQDGMGELVTTYTFVLLVALGVDYNIFLATRLREEIRARGVEDGIRRAVGRTGGVISAAGVILAGTFTILMSQPTDGLLQFGFAVSLGILLDTFLIRAVLVPATVRLLGERAWWPARLAPAPDAAGPVRDGTPARRG
ncbi:MMPL family transporter [Actinomadura darangshiensis]|uniref:MMPL family transporter n=1 Tax=Actinomadura darangshiensis TaxID=705336 RepID=A0A4R5BRJ9_9ACTN|nr:MMPL family transporter [Actinomadura darangshiensis]TDD89621.1 MMPL family transporter [Actinomadura darangshiensis]